MNVFLIFAILLGAVSPGSAQAQGSASRAVEGRILDPQGLPITGARITLTERQGGDRKTVVSSAERFRVDGLDAAVYDVRVEADGFEPQTVSADLRNQTLASVEIRLALGRVGDAVVVAATRTEQRLGDLPISGSVIRGEEIKESPAVVADDVLRQIPTFSLFRRTSSLAAHPTAQGVSLRGIGPSGVSRTLVLVDNIPFNDPFGGWVYWTRVPLTSVDHIEIVDGANSSVYGNYAAGGVINMVTSKPEHRTFILKPQYGGRRNDRIGGPAGSRVWDGLGSLDFFASDVWKNFGAALEGGYLNTNGYPQVAKTDPFNNGAVLRGPIDTKSTVNYQNLNLKLDYTPSDKTSVFFRSGYFSEDRQNAKICTVVPPPLTSCEEANDSLWKFVSGGVRTRLPDQSDLQVRMFGNWERFHSDFLAVASPGGISRSTARLSSSAGLQKVPTKDTGFTAQWSRAIWGKQYITVGTDWRWVDGDSIEDAFNATPAATAGTFINLNRIAGGTQQSLGVFVQDLITLVPRLQVTISARVDHWRNYDAHLLETNLTTGLPTVNNNPNLPEKKSTVGSPHVGALYHVSDRVSVWGGLSWGYRAPTLNELYRQFSVGTITTLANSTLGPERLFGGEAGVNVAPIRNLTWRTTWFLNNYKDPVSNVTLSVVGANITRQRQNLGKARVGGLQSDIEYRFKSYWRFFGGYVYELARVKEYVPQNAADVSLVGKFLVNVPRNRGSVHLSYGNSKYATVAVGALFSSRQYDDDQNLLRLPGYGVVDFTVNRVISRNVEAFFGMQNALDREFYVQRNPTTLGAPRLITGGLRISILGR
jgi:iron complex outermembrane receptor protein